MNFEEYQKKAHGTAIYPDLYLKTPSGEYVPFPVYPVIGLGGETGEVMEKVKKILRDKNGVVDEETAKLLDKELGDGLWYIAEVATRFNRNLQAIAEKNIEKLAKRAAQDQIKGDGDTREEETPMDTPEEVEQRRGF